MILRDLPRHDSSAPTVGKIYSGWFEMGESLKAASAPYKDQVIEKFDTRWAYGHSDFAAAAYVVDPEYHEHDQATNEEIMQGFLDTVERISILLAVRRRQKDYEEAWAKRKELIANDPKKFKVYDHYPKYPTVADKEVQEFAIAVNAQLVLYRGKKGMFARDWVMKSAETMPAHLWWDQYGASTPELQLFACLVLSQPGSASICERINSEFAFIKDRRRNRLGHEKANKLVGLFHNLRLMAKMNKTQYVESAVGWNGDELKSGITKFGIVNHS